jgi:HEAT repeat protein
VYRDVLPRCGPVFAALQRLRELDVVERRRAADELAGLAHRQPLGRLAVVRLCELVTPESDATVWQSALQAVADDTSEPATRLARIGLGHAAADVRRQACAYLAAHPAPAHARFLLPLLQDGNRGVVLAAVRAVALTDAVEAVGPLEAVLASPDEELQLEASRALVRLHDAAGKAALERLTYSDDPKSRAGAARVMGQLADPAFAASLVRLLDDSRETVRWAALESLPKVARADVGKDAAGPPVATPEQIRRWKAWLAGAKP